EMIRWQWRDEATALTISFDKRDSLGKLLKLPFWLPKGALQLVVRGSEGLKAGQLIYPNF
ncbi:MAG: hypothetical protein KDE09_25240, partial [Anaerolineales bacterium]|nr:hypothetical protein [Anaerolineales bacterium]